jgi:sulfite oxidase
MRIDRRADGNTDFDRRKFVTFSTLGLLAPSALLAGIKSAALAGAQMLQVNGYPVNAETPLELLTDYLTPNELFFVRSHWIPRTPDAKNSTLSVDGGVGKPLSLSIAQLRKLPRTEMTCVLQCAGNGRALYSPALPGVQWKAGAVGNARWGGLRVKELLHIAGLNPSGQHLQTFGSDNSPGKVPPFHRSLELEKALEDAIVAFEMNGQPLPVEHGGPLRLVVPGWAGDHWMKWLTRLVVSETPQTGFYMDTAYRYPLGPAEPGVSFKPEEMRPVTELFVKSSITTAPSRVRLADTARITGFALSGAPGIARVEVSDDDGASWREADLDPRSDRYSWRLWSYRWRPSKPGSARLFARATDSRGAIQPRVAVWNQSGYLHNAWPSAEIEVTS